MFKRSLNHPWQPFMEEICDDISKTTHGTLFVFKAVESSLDDINLLTKTLPDFKEMFKSHPILTFLTRKSPRWTSDDTRRLTSQLYSPGKARLFSIHGDLAMYRSSTYSSVIFQEVLDKTRSRPLLKDLLASDASMVGQQARNVT